MLVDTSVWIDHLRRRDATLVAALERGEIHTHPFVIGELACGPLPRRESTLAALALLPMVRLATDGDAHVLLAHERIWSRGIGWVDLRLLASALPSGVPLWTRDARLAAVASRLGVFRSPSGTCPNFHPG